MNNESCPFFYFGLLVTGKSEESYLPNLFLSLMRLGICTFQTIRKIEQLDPISSPKKLRRKENGKGIPDRDAQRIGFPARQYLQKPCSFVLLIDDLEDDRKEKIEQVFQLYRKILDEILKQDKDRASVHFLVNMLEAYYFADTTATNGVLGTSLEDYEGDVEEIRHPKNDLNKKVKELDKNRKFKEKEDGGKILELLNVEKILSNPETCASLRTIFAWCMQRMGQEFGDRYQLKTGKLNEITKTQI
ncbi:MAG: DUF4276 family protein [Cyanobacteria bacterium SBLK]|nr:DUF4276 family protein [Cyanobacteria bacterium SBLK]